ncbi:MAG: GNAT family N-acetyltransferase [Blastochloris sp.]|nr:GNAT family N-acetyltransferase [Blastochloris sp.]
MSTTLIAQPARLPSLYSTETYSLCQAQTPADLEEVQRLRFRVFNLELKEGLESAYQTGRDADAFDWVCDHLMVIHKPSQKVVGTYRMQTGVSAAAHRGYYSAQEFNFAPFEKFRLEIVELGRACVEKPHRSVSVLNLLWRGIARYARERGGRYLIGCSSLTSQDAALGRAMFESLASEHLASPEWRTSPLPALRLPPSEGFAETPYPPRLFAAYLGLGAKICGEPALDREFQTIDFLTVLDLKGLHSAARRYLSP